MQDGKGDGEGEKDDEGGVDVKRVIMCDIALH